MINTIIHSKKEIVNRVFKKMFLGYNAHRVGMISAHSIAFFAVPTAYDR
ncbi:hypothetical protein RUMHYD_02983 [Blautia hydrogenotrophica DSM 10507]|uniref:Uncharacterized protein n=1 Tax=Blautia hydrogenotrophica (strain DSM 10507 / JCM 14656 / S5a33) TaxID=476272 RepID=C0CQ31_BLAHS|nr:hypothetical protein RUMHYD_02983 [Blautia hydrogenotrophica DSM 10507]